MAKLGTELDMGSNIPSMDSTISMVCKEGTSNMDNNTEIMVVDMGSRLHTDNSLVSFLDISSSSSSSHNNNNSNSLTDHHTFTVNSNSKQFHRLLKSRTRHRLPVLPLQLLPRVEPLPLLLLLPPLLQKCSKSGVMQLQKF